MKESIFQGELKKTFESYGVWCEKFPDGIKTRDTRFIPSKPADMIVVGKHSSILVECKQIRKIGKVNRNFFGNDKEKKDKVEFFNYRQVRELVRFSHFTGQKAYYAINIRCKGVNSLVFWNVNEFIEYFIKNDCIQKEELLFMAKTGIPGRKKLFRSDSFQTFLNLM